MSELSSVRTMRDGSRSDSPEKPAGGSGGSALPAGKESTNDLPVDPLLGELNVRNSVFISRGHLRKQNPQTTTGCPPVVGYALTTAVASPVLAGVTVTIHLRSGEMVGAFTA